MLFSALVYLEVQTECTLSIFIFIQANFEQFLTDRQASQLPEETKNIKKTHPAV